MATHYSAGDACERIEGAAAVSRWLYCGGDLLTMS